MKRFMLFLIGVVLCASCSINDDNPRIDVEYKLAPIETVTVPDTMIKRKEYEIAVSYRLPSNCHTFNGIIAEEDENLLYIGVQTMVETEKMCEDIPGETIQTSFKFTPPIEFDTYTFKFWQAKNEQGEAIYLTKEVVLVSKTNGV